jgi:hypothetical protein
MALFDDLQLNTNNDADATERNVAGQLVEGIHHAVLNSHREVTANSGSRGRELTFLIIAGPSLGMTVKETLWLSSPGDDDAKLAKKADRAKLFASRVGLLTKVKKKVVVNGKETEKSIYEPAAGKSDFHQCTGAEVLIEVELEDDTYEKNGKTIRTKRARLSYEGLIPLDDKRGKDVPRGNPADVAAGMLAAPSNSAGGSGGGPVSPPATAGKGSRDFSDLM